MDAANAEKNKGRWDLGPLPDLKANLQAGDVEEIKIKQNQNKSKNHGSAGPLK